MLRNLGDEVFDKNGSQNDYFRLNLRSWEFVHYARNFELNKNLTTDLSETTSKLVKCHYHFEKLKKWTGCFES